MAHRIVSTHRATLTGTAAALTAVNRPTTVRVWSNRNFHVAVGADATTDDYPVAEGFEGVCVVVDPGAAVTAVKATGESDGDVWFSRIRKG